MDMSESMCVHGALGLLRAVRRRTVENHPIVAMLDRQIDELESVFGWGGPAKDSSPSWQEQELAIRTIAQTLVLRSSTTVSPEKHVRDWVRRNGNKFFDIYDPRRSHGGKKNSGDLAYLSCELRRMVREHMAAVAHPLAPTDVPKKRMYNFDGLTPTRPAIRKLARRLVLENTSVVSLDEYVRNWVRQNGKQFLMDHAPFYRRENAAVSAGILACLSRALKTQMRQCMAAPLAGLRLVSGVHDAN